MANQLKSNLTALKADNCTFSKVSFASDNYGEVLRYQISQYEKQKKGINVLKQNSIDFIEESFEDKYDEYDSKRFAFDDEISEIVTNYNMSLPEDDEYVDISNPADSVEHLSSSSALYYACKDLSSLSTNTTNVDSLISRRKFREGYGLYEDQDAPNSFIDKSLYMDYLFEKLAYKDRKKDNACLNYQLEYLIAGREGDIENLEEVAERIFKIRYLINVSHIYQCALKQQQAMELAIAATSIVSQPELAEVVKQAILLAWAYAESAKDMRILFDGNKLTNVKTEEEWNTPIDQIIDFRAHLDEYKVPSGSTDYKDYLQGLLFMQDSITQNMRLMDVMEMDVRLTNGNSQFCINNLIYQLYANVNVSSKYGGGYSINRGFSYR